MRDEKELYTEKIRAILNNKIDCREDYGQATRDTTIWLTCEWQCDQISDMKLMRELLDSIYEIAREIIKHL